MYVFQISRMKGVGTKKERGQSWTRWRMGRVVLRMVILIFWDFLAQ